MPSSIEGNTYYEPGNNKLERNAKEYWDKIKGKI